MFLLPFIWNFVCVCFIDFHLINYLWYCTRLFSMYIVGQNLLYHHTIIIMDETAIAS